MVTKEFLDVVDSWGNGRCHDGGNRWCFYRGLMPQLGFGERAVSAAKAQCNGECGLKQLLLDSKRFTDLDIFMQRLKLTHVFWQKFWAEEFGHGELSEDDSNRLWEQGRYTDPKNMAPVWGRALGYFDAQGRYTGRELKVDDFYFDLIKRVRDLNEEAAWGLAAAA